VAANNDVEKIADDRARARSNNPYTARKRRQRALAVGLKKAFGFQPRFKLLKCKLQRASADGLHRFSHKLKLPALLVHAHAPADENMKAIFGTKTEQHSLAAKEYDRELRIGIFEREVNMARGCRPKIRYLALYPHIAILFLNQLANLAHELANRPDAARWTQLFKYQVQLRQVLIVGRHAKGSVNAVCDRPPSTCV